MTYKIIKIDEDHVHISEEMRNGFERVIHNIPIKDWNKFKETVNSFILLKKDSDGKRKTLALFDV